MTATAKKQEEVKALSKPDPTNGEGKLACFTADFGKLYTRVRNSQIMAPIKAVMTLFEKMGHIYKQQNKYLITAAGYRHLNKVASISIITPQSVIVDGRPVPNPHIERNPRTRAIEAVNLRKMGIGYSPAGNIVVIDKTLFFNVYTYFIQSIQAKMKRVKWTNEGGQSKKTDTPEFPGCAVYGTKDRTPKEEGAWAFYETEAPLGIWINYKSSAIIDCLEEHTQRQRFGDRIATTIVERNILRDHPALAVSQVYEKSGTSGMTASVEVFGWRNELEPQDLSGIMRQAESGDESQGFEVKAEVIDVVAEEEEKEAREEVATVDETPATQKEPPDGFFLEQEAAAKGKK